MLLLMTARMTELDSLSWTLACVSTSNRPVCPLPHGVGTTQSTERYRHCPPESLTKCPLDVRAPRHRAS